MTKRFQWSEETIMKMIEGAMDCAAKEGVDCAPESELRKYIELRTKRRSAATNSVGSLYETDYVMDGAAPVLIRKDSWKGFTLDNLAGIGNIRDAMVSGPRRDVMQAIFRNSGIKPRR